MYNNLDLSKYPTLFFGIYFGLLIGKPLGIMLFTILSTLIRISSKPKDMSWKSVFLVSLIAGIGFIMSIFVSRMFILLSGITSLILSSLTIKTFKELNII